MLTPKQIGLVQDSFAQVLPITGATAKSFYDRLFTLAPDTRTLFRSDMAEQGRKLFLTLAAVVDALGRIEDILPAAEALAIRHVGYGARDEHYAVVGTALVDALRAALGDRFDAETEAAWIGAYTVLSGCMVAAAQRHRASSPLDRRLQHV